MKEALLHRKLKNGVVRCRNCAHYCVISPGDRGTCRVQENRKGKLYSLIYGKTTT